MRPTRARRSRRALPVSWWPIVVAGLIALALIGGGVVVSLYTGLGRRVARPQAPEVPTTHAPPPVRSWLDGAPLPDSAAQPVAVAVIIDNAPEAEPLSGIADAPIVFEVPVEGRRTRFLAVFALPAPSNDGAACVGCPPSYRGPIGPVRSARPYFVGLAEAIGAPLVHVGGSPAALDMLRRDGWFHMNQYFDSPFWRDVSRPAPFNVYTAASNLGSFVRTKGWEDRLRAVIAPLWMVEDGTTPQEVPVTVSPPLSEGERPDRLATRSVAGGEGVGRGADRGNGELVRLPYGPSPYLVEWRYDVQAGVYKRSQDGRAHVVRSGGEERAITAANVVVLRVHSRVLDAIGRLEISALQPPIQPSSAVQSATVYVGGRATNGSWDWNVGGSPRFQLLSVTGEPIALRPGTTWVEVVDWDFD